MAGFAVFMTRFISALINRLYQLVLDVFLWLYGGVRYVIETYMGFDIQALLPTIDASALAPYIESVNLWIPIYDAWTLTVLHFAIWSAAIGVRWVLKAIPTIW